MKKFILMMVMVLVFVGCKNVSSDDNQEGKKKIVVWHAMGGELGEALGKVVENYNSSQENYEVEAIYQGSYDDTLGKFKAVAGSSSAPDIVQVFDGGTQFMKNNQYIKPVQEFIDRDNFDLSNLEDFILNYYRVDNKLYSMPFNSSSAILIYNKDAFKEAGLDPNTPPKSFEDIKNFSKKLTTGDRYGFAMLIESWFYEQVLANNEEYFMNNNNGRDARPTAMAFNTEKGKALFRLLRELYTEKTGSSFGRGWEDLRAAFISGKVAMYMDSSAGLKGIIDSSNFEVGTGFIPNVSGDFYGSLIGGASMWVMKNEDETMEDGAWDFLKFLTGKEEQSYWAVNTGYYPINGNSYDTDLMKENNQKYPQFETAIKQIRSSNKDKITQGALLGVYPEARQRVNLALEENFQGEKSIDEIMNSLEVDLNKIIERYNKLN